MSELMGDPEFTAEQAVQAQRELRRALGLEAERFPLAAFVGMISDEIEQMRDAGRSDAEISRIVADASGTRIEADDLSRFYAPPEARRPRSSE